MSNDNNDTANVSAMCKALNSIVNIAEDAFNCPERDREASQGRALSLVSDAARAALAAPPHKGKWKNGTEYEYEYAYCSECGRMQWAGWDTHKQAKENIESFAHDYKFCPGCGAEMEGGVYIQ